MTVFGFDAAGRLSGAAVAAARAAFVARYLDFGGRSIKTFLSRDEVDDLRRHGVAVLPVWESTTGRARDGQAAGRADATRAAAQLDALGMGDAVAWWTADADMTERDRDAVLGYARGWAGVIPPERTGVYGDADVLDWVVGVGLARYGWQAAAASWSGRRVSGHAHLIQRVGTVEVGGVPADRDDVLTTSGDYGQWPRPAAPAATRDEGEDDMVGGLYQVQGESLVCVGGPGYWRGLRSAAERDALSGPGGYGPVRVITASQRDTLRDAFLRMAAPPVDVVALAEAVVARLPRDAGTLTRADVEAATQAALHQALAAGADATGAGQ